MQYFKITPKNSQVLLQYLVKPKFTKQGIQLPAAPGKDDPCQRAVVLAVSDGVSACKPGDIVYVFINDGISIERLFRARFRQDEGDIKFYKETAILCVAEQLNGMTEEGFHAPERPLNIIEAYEIEDLVGVRMSDITPVIPAHPGFGGR